MEISKWVSGSRTVLASTAGFSLPVDAVVAFGDTGGALTLWTGSAGLTQVLSEIDNTYEGGYAGIEMNGGAGTLYD